MNWRNVWLIFQREVRDQLRDRRTLFMIFVLPILLYPLMGVVLSRFAQFMQETSTLVRVYGHEALPAEPQLIAGRQFAASWFGGKPALLELELAAAPPGPAEEAFARVRAAAQEDLERGRVHAVLYFPTDFGPTVQAYHAELTAGKRPDAARIPQPRVLYNSAKKSSAVTMSRLDRVLERWRQAIAERNRTAAQLPEATPFAVEEFDLADEEMRHAATWSTIFPFLMLVWALTGAFYPAVDLCAGEKERGTLETLLVSPAQRGEIVCGKLLTTMLFSMATVVLNLVSVGMTGSFLISRFGNIVPGLGPPPLLAYLWLFLAMVPVSALFSALCLALAAFARSSKEGQYYLMPLFLVTMPLVILPMLPSFQLTLGNSLIPITGVVLLLRSAIAGEYLDALRYFLPVTMVTAICCYLGIRWAIDQFNKESVLFREGERMDVRLWLRHVIRDRDETPTAAMAFCCAGLILVLQFVFSKATENSGASPLQLTAALLLVGVLTPALLMAVMLTRSPRKTLSLFWPKWGTIPAAVALAIVWHPLAHTLSKVVYWVYPLSHEWQEAIKEFFGKKDNSPPFAVLWLVIALLPAVCEEFAFRGFILAGFRNLGRKWAALLLSSVIFGFTHAIWQQSIMAAITGVLLAYVVVQTGSLLTGIIVHLVNNTLVLMVAQVDAEGWRAIAAHPFWRFILADVTADDFRYQWYILPILLLALVTLLKYFHDLPYVRTGEEALQEARDLADARTPAL